VTWLEAFAFALEIGIITFSALYGMCNVGLLLIGLNLARRQVRTLGFSDFDLMDDDGSCPPVAVIVPAYNEAAGIRDSVRTLTKLDYPRVEIIVVNDGSRDHTLEELQAEFAMERRDVPQRGELETARIRGIYEATVPLARNVERLLVIDKENGGRADALNAAVNFCCSPWFVTVDGDSILDRSTLKQVMRILLDDPETLAVGGQIGVVNDSTLEGGVVAGRRVARSFLSLCQSLEYVRSFTTMRTGFARLNALLILSGAFQMLPREKVLAVGGFLTARARSKLLEEYVGLGRTTKGEDMEIIVRLHRYEREHGRQAKVVHTPIPVCWTEVPSTWKVLGRQRRRWHQGLLEILHFNRGLVLNPKYGRVGLFSLPYLVLFEALGVFVEAAGYVFLPLFAWQGIIDPGRAALVIAVALGFGALQSSVSVLAATWLEPDVPTGSQVRSVLGMENWRDRALLLAACVVSELGYRQALVWWRLRGTWDYLRRNSNWGNMERRGFRVAVKAALAIVLVLAPAEAAAEFRVSTVTSVLGGTEHREGGDLGWWSEVSHRWNPVSTRIPWVSAVWVGGFSVDRAAGVDGGILAGISLKPLRHAGSALEVRVAPGTASSPRWIIHWEGEALVRAPVSATWVARTSSYAEVGVVDLAPGAVVYLPRDAWLAVRGHFLFTRFEEGGGHDTRGLAAMLSVRYRELELRFVGNSGGESIHAGPHPRELHSRSAGLIARFLATPRLRVEGSVVRRNPESGPDNLYLGVGIQRQW
jgi:cellulose synthase/poly-beta-1,6-N-acetylglucosamine synthase-like glycosyltransferase